ncbi:MAG: hypothetical protein QOG85_1203 [Gaiellaceae bacterium]|nr:hypothetical protein [Gaiellaceae bacterium]
MTAAAFVTRLAEIYTDEPEYMSGLRFGGLEPQDELHATALATGESVEALLDQVGQALARGFGTGELPYQFCDDLVDHLVPVYDEVDGRGHLVLGGLHRV